MNPSRAHPVTIGDADRSPAELRHWLAAAAAAHPDQIALDAPGARLSYRELLDSTRMLVARMAAAGIGKDDRVAVAATRSADTVIAILAAVDAGAAYVPLDLGYPPERLRAMLAESSPRAVLGGDAALASLRQRIGDFATLDAPAAAGGEPPAGAANLAYVLFTSGSTGTPKGVAMGSLPLRHLIDWHARHPRLGAPARVLQFAPFSFDVHFQEIFSTMACAGTLVLIEEESRRDPARLHDALVEHRITRLFAPYVALQMVADASVEVVPPDLQDIISAGEQLQVTPSIRSLFMRLGQAQLHNHYGPTESHVVTAHELDGDASSWPDIPPIGKALPHVRLALRGDGGQIRQPVDGACAEPGELLIGGETLANGYLGRPELTAERFLEAVPGLAGRWYATGDLATCDADGAFIYHGRADQQVKVDGFRIEPAEIELALMACEEIKEAVVTAPELPGIGRQLLAHVVRRNGHGDDPELANRLRAHLRRTLPDHMIPARFIAIASLPTTPSGKIDRKQLPLPKAASAAQLPRKPLELLRVVWQELLGVPRIADDDNLFDLGARSLLVIRFVSRLRELGITALSVAHVYDRPTLAGQAATLDDAPVPRTASTAATTTTTAAVAVVGMAVRVPGAADLEAFWQNLLQGLDSIRQFDDAELHPSVPADLRRQPNFVAARGWLADADRFDAALFGISSREATLLDPQQRLMLELSWSALEHAAIDPAATDARIGVYAGTGNNTYAHALRNARQDLVHQAGEFALMLASEKDYVATRIANRLNLRGPAISIHTACSTSLVAVAQAWHALAGGQCDVALAGGASVLVPQNGGYLHVEGGMESADGRCRPFDADASGTVFSSGGGVVVLKRLEDAERDHDTIYCVIRGVGLNNDGGNKASFTAPSMSGQAEVIRAALAHARVDPRSIGYVEAHGTATSLGDPIEIAGLAAAWQAETADTGFCGIGSVKGNLGHLTAGAGVVGLVKAALALSRQIIPATVNYTRPNPQIDFPRTPFKVVDRNTPWPRGTVVRRAAVSSFGVGGTNAHVVLEEAPATAVEITTGIAPEPEPDSAEDRLLVLPLSANSPTAALRRAAQLADFLEQRPRLRLAEVAATLMRGRRPLAHRLAVVAANPPEAVQALRRASRTTAAARPRLVFLFPGQGSQHPGMANRLYDEAPAFREALDRALAEVRPAAQAAALRHWIVEAAPGDGEAAASLADTRHAQPALFAMSYALACWLDSLGVRPDALIGHSIGEYAGACLAGVMSLPVAMGAVVARAEAMANQKPGAMLAVQAGIEDLGRLLTAGVEIAAVNAPAVTSVAGDVDDIARLQAVLEASGVEASRLHVSHAFHSAAMEGATAALVAQLSTTVLEPPHVPLYSCVSGAPLEDREATDPLYWAAQVRRTVQFSRALQAELRHPDTVFVEVGPGQALTALARQHRNSGGTPPRVIPLLGTARSPGVPAEKAFGALGELWCAGVAVAWPVAASARRQPLPTYPFEGERHWFEPITGVAAATPSPIAAVADAAPSPIIHQPDDMSRLPRIEEELKRVLGEVAGMSEAEIANDATFLDQGLDSLALTQFTLAIQQAFDVKLRFRRLMDDLGSVQALARHLDGELPADRFAAPAAAAATDPMSTEAAALTATEGLPASAAAAAGTSSMKSLMAAEAPRGETTAKAALQAPDDSLVRHVIDQQMRLMSEHLLLLGPRSAPAAEQVASGAQAAAIPAKTAQPAATAAEPARSAAQPSTTAVKPATAGGAAAEAVATRALVDAPFGASPRLTLQAAQDLSARQSAWLQGFIARYNARSGRSKAFSQQHRRLMADPRVVTGFHPDWKDLVYPIVVDRSSGARLWDLDGNEYIDLLSGFGGNLLGYQPDEVVAALKEQIEAGFEVGPQHPLSAEVAALIAEFTGMERVAFCNTGSEAVMGAMRIARCVTGRKTIAIFNNSYHGIFDEVIVRGTRQLRSVSAAPGILANAVENIIVLDYGSDEALEVLRKRGPELAAIMLEPIQNKNPTLQPRRFVQALRGICDDAGCALIFDEVVTGFRVAPGGAQQFYDVRADIATYGKIIGGGLPFAAIAGAGHWLDALDGGTWQYGDSSYPEAGVTYFAGTYVRHPLALAAARATLLWLKRGGREFYRSLNDRTQRLVDRLNAAFSAMGAPAKAVHCASLWRLHWDAEQKYVSLFYYLARFNGLHLYEQFGHFVTDAMREQELDRIVEVFTGAMRELIQLGLLSNKVAGASEQPTTSREQAPLAPGQTERWLVAGFDDAARLALNESLCLSLRGDVDPAILTDALQDVLSRHVAFRLVIDRDEPRQSLAQLRRLEIAQVDLTQRPDCDRALEEFCDQASLRDFPLGTAPMAAVSVLRLADGRVVMHLVASHLVFDGWASPVFVRELAEAYRARAAGRLPVLQPAESALDFAAAEAERFNGAEGEPSRRYWKATLANPPAALALGDLEPPRLRRYAADTVRTAFDEDSLRRLRKCARDSGATLFQLLLAAVAATLQARSGKQDFLVCVPFASQSLGRHAPLIADGVLDLPLRISCRPSDTGAELLDRVQAALMDALEHPLMTQGAAARALDIRSVGDRPPLTGVFFNLNPRIDLAGFAPLTATVHEGRKRAILNELFFNFYESDTALTLDLHYSAEHFTPALARRITSELEAVCCALAVSTATPLAAYLTAPASPPAASVDARVREWNHTAVPLDDALRAEAQVAARAARAPDSIALQTDAGALTYRELDARANRIANVLRAQGIGSGKLVGICLGRGPDLVPALLGILKTGAAYVPLDPGFPAERLRYMAEDAAIAFVVSEAKHGELAGLPRQRQLLVDQDQPLLSATADVAPPVTGSLDDPAYVIYTSGSTGRPKGVVISHRSLSNFLASMSRRPGIEPHQRLLAVTTLSFDIAVLELLLPLVTGAQVVLAQRHQAMDGVELARVLREHRIDMMQATPATWHLLLDSGWQPPAGFRVLCGGEPLQPPLAARLLALGVELWNMYGPTETTVWSTVAPIRRADQKISIGGPIENTSIWILDEAMKPCAIGQPGEICIGGAGVAIGYLNRPDLTTERFVPDPFDPTPGARLYRTGDLGVWRENGSLEHLGRIDSQVKIRGYRIELGEIEARIEEIPGVARSVVSARKDELGDAWLEGVLLAASGATVEVSRVRDTLRKTLPDYMIPRHVALVETLPVLPNGKIDRGAVPVLATATPGLQESTPGPTPGGRHEEAPLQAKLAAWMAELLGVPAVGPDQNFFELGAHSLLAARLNARIAQETGTRPGLRAIFESPTPAQLAAALERQAAQPGGDAAEIPVRPDQRAAPLSFMQQRVWYLENLSPGTAVHNTPSGHRFLGPLDVDCLTEAFRMLIGRQSVLRTVIERTPDGDRQRILDSVELERLPLDDLTALPPAERERQMQRRIAELVTVPYDLEHGPLFTIHLFRLSAEEHGMLFMVHHLIWDGWSFDLLYEELRELYEAALARRAPQLRPITVSYGDFAAWHADWMSGKELERQTQQWARMLTPLPPPLDLPLDHPRPPAMSGRGGSHQVDVPGDIVARLRHEAQQHGRTLYVTLLGAFGLLLNQLSRQTDFVVGTPVRGREQPALEPVMGFFVNMLPMRLQLAADRRLKDWLTGLHDQVVRSFSSPDVPFDHLVRQLKMPRDRSRPPIHQVSFSYQDIRERPTRWGGVENQRMAVPILGAAQDLSLWCVETRDHLECVFTFNSDVLDPATVATFAERFAGILRQMSQDPDGGLRSYDGLRSAEPAPAAMAPSTGAVATAGAAQPQPAAVALVAPAASPAVAMPRTPVETAIADIWRTLLNLDQIHLTDNFFDLGGHSLLAMRAATEIRKRFGIDPHLHHLIFENLGQVASGIEKELSSMDAPSSQKRSWWNAVLHKFVP